MIDRPGSPGDPDVPAAATRTISLVARDDDRFQKLIRRLAAEIGGSRCVSCGRGQVMAVAATSST